MTDDYWASLERRVSDVDSKMSLLLHNYQRDITRLDQENKEVTNRVNMGLSPSVQKVIQENADNRLAIATIRNEFEKAINEMKSVVRETTDLTKLMVSNFQEHKLKPVEEEVGLMKKTFVYGLVGAVIVFLGQKGLSIVWDKVVKSEIPAAVASLPPPPEKRK